MGSRCCIFTDPKKWSVYNTDKHLKLELGGECLYKVIYGLFDDDLTGIQEMTMFMKYSVYNCLMSGKYEVSPKSHDMRKLIIQDKKGNEIVPVRDNYCY